ncbi:MAG: hypothetical protein ACTSUR_02740 [Candidatus Heimdallarchaeaceae archaeon]
MSETTTPQTTRRPTCWKSCGYWDALIGGFLLIVFGIMMFFSSFSASLFNFGGASFISFGKLVWVTALVQVVLGLFVLLLLFKPLQALLKIGELIKEDMWLGIVLLIIGLITGGMGGILVLLGGIFYLISVSKKK